ncbi:hypothetical protein D3C76_1282740 [compost metagenome]
MPPAVSAYYRHLPERKAVYPVQQGDLLPQRAGFASVPDCVYGFADAVVHGTDHCADCGLHRDQHGDEHCCRLPVDQGPAEGQNLLYDADCVHHVLRRRPDPRISAGEAAGYAGQPEFPDFPRYDQRLQPDYSADVLPLHPGQPGGVRLY